MKIINSIKIKHNHWKHVVSKDQLRPVMNGVFFDLAKECMVATNSHLLLIIPIEIEWSKEENEGLDEVEKKCILKNQSKIVPVELFDERKYMGNPKYYLSETYYDFSDENYARVYNGAECVFRCKFIDGGFPNYEAVFPESTESVETIGVDFSMVKKIFDAIPFKDKFLDFKFTAKNRAIKFSYRMDSRIQGVIMPMTRL